MALRLSAADAKRFGVPLAKPGAKPTPAKLCSRKSANSEPSRWSFTLSVPTTVRSEANCREHWSKKVRRKHGQQAALWAAIKLSPVRMEDVLFPVVVTWVRIGAQAMDSDNLANAFKGLRDELAMLMRIDDGSPRVTWRYEQRTGKPGVELRIEHGNEAA